MALPISSSCFMSSQNLIDSFINFLHSLAGQLKAILHFEYLTLYLC